MNTEGSDSEKEPPKTETRSTSAESLRRPRSQALLTSFVPNSSESYEVSLLADAMDYVREELVSPIPKIFKSSRSPRDSPRSNDHSKKLKYQQSSDRKKFLVKRSSSSVASIIPSGFKTPREYLKGIGKKGLLAKGSDHLAALKIPLGSYEASISELATLVDTDQDFFYLFEQGDKLGEGGFGSVFKALHKESGKTFVVKSINFELLADPEPMQLLIRELRVLKMTDHPNIVKSIQSYLNVKKLYIVLEYCERGSLSDYYAAYGSLTENQISFVCYSVLSALSYLHGKGIIHRDVKAANILITNDGKIKLSDFGTCAMISLNNETDETINRKHITPNKRYTFIGSPYWMSPEVLKNSNSKSPYDFSTDTWSLGITMIECAEGDPPHTKIGPMRAIHIIPISDPPLLTKGSNEFKDFTSKCLQKEPSERPSCIQLLKHPFVSKVTSTNFFEIESINNHPSSPTRKLFRLGGYRLKVSNTQSTTESGSSSEESSDWSEWSCVASEAVTNYVTKHLTKQSPNGEIDANKKKFVGTAIEQLKHPIIKGQFDELRKLTHRHNKEINMFQKSLQKEIMRIKKLAVANIKKQMESCTNISREVADKHFKTMQIKINELERKEAVRSGNDKDKLEFERIVQILAQSKMLEELKLSQVFERQFIDKVEQTEIEASHTVWELEKIFFIDDLHSLLSTHQIERHTIEQMQCKRRCNKMQKHFLKIFENSKGLNDKSKELKEKLEQERKIEEEELKKFHDMEKKNLEDSAIEMKERLKKVHRKVSELLFCRQQKRRQYMAEQQLYKWKKMKHLTERLKSSLAKSYGLQYEIPPTISNSFRNLREQKGKESPKMLAFNEIDNRFCKELKEIDRSEEITHNLLLTAPNNVMTLIIQNKENEKT